MNAVPIIVFASSVVLLVMISLYNRGLLYFPDIFENDIDLDKVALKRTKRAFPASTRIIMQVIVSLTVLTAAIYIIVSHEFDAKDKHWAYGSAGTILGFWLKG